MEQQGKRATRSSFELYLRTGRWVDAHPLGSDIEVKFNPWHDPDDGRFTFKGQGQFFASGAPGATRPASSRGAASKASAAKPSQKARQGTWTGGGFTSGGGGSFGGGGASSREPWGSDLPRKQRLPASVASKPAQTQRPVVVVAPPALPAEKWTRATSNGYRFDIDASNRTRRTGGVLTLAKSKRSPNNQAKAGGADRRANDDGGHYIGVRFGGPHDKFNHFAQNSNFNRGGYRVLEDVWEKEIRAGHRVSVDIVPKYTGSSQRPDAITIRWTVDGEPDERFFPNEQKEKVRGKK